MSTTSVFVVYCSIMHVIPFEEKITKRWENSAWSLFKDPITIMNYVYHIGALLEAKTDIIAKVHLILFTVL